MRTTDTCFLANEQISSHRKLTSKMRTLQYQLYYYYKKPFWLEGKSSSVDSISMFATIFMHQTSCGCMQRTVFQCFLQTYLMRTPR